MQKPLYVNALLLSAVLGLNTAAPQAAEHEHGQEAAAPAQGHEEHGHGGGRGIVGAMEDQNKDLLRQQIEREFAVPMDTVVAEINGSKITQGEYLMYFQARLKGAKEPIPRDELMEEIINREVVVQDAEKKAWMEDEATKLRIAVMRKKVISEIAAYRMLQENPPTEEEVKAFYEEKYTKGEAPKEYHARHILVKTEEEAKKLIAELDKGADFAKLAEEHSLDKGSAKKGGDLDWFRDDRMVKPFAEGMLALKEKTYTKEPVQTDFGWHIILLEGIRDVPPPPYERMKPMLAQELQSKRAADQMKALREAAKIEIHAPPAAPPAAEAEEKK